MTVLVVFTTDNPPARLVEHVVSIREQLNRIDLRVKRHHDYTTQSFRRDEILTLRCRIHH